MASSDPAGHTWILFLIALAVILNKRLHAGCGMLQQQPFDNRTFCDVINVVNIFFPLFHLLQLSPLQHSSSCVSLAVSTSQMFSTKSLLCVLATNAYSNCLTAESVFWGLCLTSAFTARFKCVHIHHFLNKRLPSAFQVHMRLVLADDILNTPRFFRMICLNKEENIPFVLRVGMFLAPINRIECLYQ